MDMETKQAFDLVLSELKDMRTEISDIRSELVEIRSDIVEIRSDIVEIRADIDDMKADITEIKATMATKDQVASVMIALNNSNLDLTAKDDELERAIKQNSYDIVKLRAAQ